MRMGRRDMTMLSFFVSQERTQAHLERLLNQSNLKVRPPSCLTLPVH
jgi:hypothetical protein